MSRSSFPRPEHVALLRQRIAARLQGDSISLEMSERGVDHYRCCYRYGFRRRGDNEWKDLSIHFQIVERLEQGGDASELEELLNLFLERNFSAAAAAKRSG